MSAWRVECVEFGNDRLDHLDGWQGIAWAVTSEEGDVFSLHTSREAAERVLASRTVEAVVRDALDKVTDALTERQVEAVVRRVSEALSG